MGGEGVGGRVFSQDAMARQQSGTCGAKSQLRGALWVRLPLSKVSVGVCEVTLRM